MSPQRLQLGVAVNLLQGLKPTYCCNGAESPLPLAPHQPFVPQEPGEEDAEAPWQGPRLSLHEDVDGLVDALFHYHALPFQIDAGLPFRLPTSALMLRRETRQQALAQLALLLGLELRPGDGYLLLSVRREVGNFQHEAERGGIARFLAIKDYWTREGRHSMARLRPGERTFPGAETAGKAPASISVLQAQRYLDYFQESGTHFVSRIVFGQALFQVFRCRPKRRLLLADTLRRESGGAQEIGLPLLIGLRPLLETEFVDARGAIFSACHDPELQAAQRDGAFSDPAGKAESLLRPFLQSPVVARDLLARLRETGPIRLSLTPQTSLMENFRAVTAAQILKGALLQQFGKTISLPGSAFPALS